MNKPIIILDAFLYSQERIDLFEKTLKKIKQINLPILLISNTTISQDIQKQVDYFIYDKNDILFEYKYDSYPFCNNYLKTENFVWEQHTYIKQKHGLSVLCNLTKSCDFSMKQGFNKFIRFEWDFLIHDDDLDKIKNLIYNFIDSDQKAFFVLNPCNMEQEPDLCYHFWMVDFDFWNQKFPKIMNEIDYQNFIFNKNNNKKFIIAERFSYLVFKDYLNEMAFITPEDFKNTIAPNSSLDVIATDTTFSPPNGIGVNRGLTRVWKNGKQTDEFIFMTYNRMNKNIDINDYYITFNNQTQHIHNEVGLGNYIYHLIEGLNCSKFPVILNVNNKFEIIYNSSSDVTNLMFFF